MTTNETSELIPPSVILSCYITIRKGETLFIHKTPLYQTLTHYRVTSSLTPVTGVRESTCMCVNMCYIYVSIDINRNIDEL